MELRDYIRVLARRKSTVILTILAALITVAVGSVSIPPTYSATTTLRAAISSVNDIRYDDLQYSERLLRTMAVLATGSPMLTELARTLGVSTPPRITAEIVLNTELIEITAEARDPGAAQEAANTLGDLLVKSARELYVGEGESAVRIIGEQLVEVEGELKQVRQRYATMVSAQELAAARRDVELKEQAYASLAAEYQKAQTAALLQANALSIVEPAIMPVKPSKPRLALNLVVGLLLGLASGLGLAFLSEHLDTTFHSSEQIGQVVQHSSLAVIPLARGRPGPVLYQGNSPQGESFRRLRAAVFGYADGSGPKTLLVASAQPKEGRSTVVANLAYALAQSGRSVIIIDGDLRSPAIHTLFDLSNAKGLSSILKPDLSLDEAIQETAVPGLCVLTSGPLPPEPSAMLEGKRFAIVVAQLSRRFDVVLLDGPALLSAVDASVLATSADGVLLVVSLALTEPAALQRADRQLAQAQTNVIGIVVNRASATDDALL